MEKNSNHFQPRQRMPRYSGRIKFKKGMTQRFKIAAGYFVTGRFDWKGRFLAAYALTPLFIQSSGPLPFYGRGITIAYFEPSHVPAYGSGGRNRLNILSENKIPLSVKQKML